MPLLLLLLLLSVGKARCPQLEYDNEVRENDCGCLHDAESAVSNLFPLVT